MKIRKTTLSEIDCARILEGGETILFLHEDSIWKIAEIVVHNRGEENEFYKFEIEGNELEIEHSGVWDHFYLIETPFDPSPFWSKLKGTQEI